MMTYNAEQRDAIMQMPSAVLLSAMLAEAGSKITDIREFMAGEQFISRSAKNFPQNRLVQDVVKNASVDRVEAAIKNILAMGDKSRMRSECENRINLGASALGNDEEGSQFKAFLVRLAEVVVSATRGGILGTQGEKVSPQEAEFVERLRQRLAV